MKYFTYFLVFIIVFSLGMNCVRIDELEDAEQKVKGSLDRFYEALENNDLNGIMSLYLKKSTTVMLGSEVKDRFAGWEKIREKWSGILQDVESIKIFKSSETIQIGSDVQTAWITSVNRVEIKTAKGDKANTVFFSAVLENRAGRWFFAQTHFSIPGEIEKDGTTNEATAIDSIADEIKSEVKKLDRDTTSVKIPTDSTVNKINEKKENY